MNYSSTYTRLHEPGPRSPRTFFLHRNGVRSKVEVEDLAEGQIFSVETNDETDEFYGDNRLFRCTGPAMTVLGNTAIPCEPI